MAFAEWAGIAAPYDRSFGALCACTVPEVLVELAAAGRLLDVGTGTGSVAISAARVGWAVDAFDAERSMVDFAMQRADAAGIRFVTAALPHLPYPDQAFDAVTANFVLNHIDHPRAGLAELRRVLRPGGRLVATVWPWEATPTGRLWRELQDETGAYPPPGTRLPEGSDFDRSEEGLAGLLAECGFAEVRARRVHFTWRVDADELWSGVEAGIAVMGYAYAAADASTRAALRAAYDARTPALTGDDGLLHFGLSAVLASAVRPVQKSDS
ncbi:class I SAM-dependent methyltransferase [Gryllotalpicola protaetiae]|uniref:Class I SAM-dependent methyltransferase n=1 Tax=Gryllotalpicola protaetiae TaxID=2419771 RepID=A0A387BQW2_9MICO|nr:class I SAM-dependent methyltransferase [Gryllotalpicola protaetiae]AYG03366.1 class I SAM-dependent methyltransferase [Gryllotalpicola protaetiae]